MEAKLIVVGGKANKAEVKLTLPVIIGRGRDADLAVAHATVSRRHCMLYERDGALVVRDNGSLNGTVIEGEKIKEAVLKPGATLTVGPLTFRAEYEHDGEFPSVGEQPTLPNVHDTVGDKTTSSAETIQVEPPAAPIEVSAAPEPPIADGDSNLPQLDDSAPLEGASVADSALDLNLPELDPPAAEEAPSFGFLSEPVEAPAKHGESDSPVAAADDDDSASFGFLGGLEEKTGPGKADSQGPEITLHDPEEPGAAEQVSGEYSLSAEPKPAVAAAAAMKSPTAGAGKPELDMEAAALDFLSEAPSAGSGAAKSSKAAGKPASQAESAPEIKVGTERPKAAAPEDDELNNFFESIGLD